MNCLAKVVIADMDSYGFENVVEKEEGKLPKIVQKSRYPSSGSSFLPNGDPQEDVLNWPGPYFTNYYNFSDDKKYVHYAPLIMSQKESPRNHPWAIPG